MSLNQISRELKRLDKMFALPHRGDKIYRAKPARKIKKAWWQYIYSLFF